MSLKVSEVKFANHLSDFERKTMRRRAVFKKSEKAKSFHEIIAPVIVLGNVFSIFPVSGIFSKDAADVKFRFLYPVTVISAVIQLCFVVELVLLFIFLSKSGFKFFMVGQTIFTTTCIFGGTYFFYLATQWRRIITSWLEHERVFLHPPYSSKIEGNFVRKIHAIAFFTIFLALLDHYIYIGSAFERVADQITSCDEHQRDFWKILYINERQVFYTFLPYYSWQIPFMEVYEVVKAICWTYSEVFINAMSITLTARFQQLTNRLKCHEKQHLGDTYWHEIRSHYNILCNLVLKADKVLSPFLLVYCFSNMFFMCQKLFTQFEGQRRPWERYYSYYSSVFLIIRTAGMLCLGASVNEKSRAALGLMREVPNKSYAGLDYHRLLDVIHSNTVALSGFRFFFITKGMILTLAGTIFTYELVLVQQIQGITSKDNVTTNACGEIYV